MMDMRAQEKLGKARSLKEMKHELIDKKSNGKEKCPLSSPSGESPAWVSCCVTLLMDHFLFPNYWKVGLSDCTCWCFLLTNHHDVL